MTEPTGSSHVKDLTEQFHVVLDNALRGQSVLIDKLADGVLTYCQFAEVDKEWTDVTVKKTGKIRHDLLQVLLWEHNWGGPRPTL